MRVVDDEIREEGVNGIMKSLVGYAKEFGFHCKAMVRRGRILSRK